MMTQKDISNKGRKEKRFTLVIPEELHKKALESCEKEGYESLTDFFLTLIRRQTQPHSSSQKETGKSGEKPGRKSLDERISETTEEIGRIISTLDRKRLVLRSIRWELAKKNEGADYEKHLN